MHTWVLARIFEGELPLVPCRLSVPGVGGRVETRELPEAEPVGDVDTPWGGDGARFCGLRAAGAGGEGELLCVVCMPVERPVLWEGGKGHVSKK